MTAHATPRYASQIDAFTFGEHQPAATARRAQVRRLAGRLTVEGSGGHRAEPGPYHLYAGWFCPRSHRATLVLALAGLTDTVSVSYIDKFRDGRGWAFRERTGPDPVNGFTLLREAYQATDPDYDGAITVPILWDRRLGRVVSNDPDTIDVDLAVAFETGLYPLSQRTAIDRLNRQSAELSRSITRAVYSLPAKDELAGRLRELDDHLSGRAHLVGGALTLADIRLWVLLVRYDAGPNATGAAGPPLTRFPNLWRYARDLYRLPAFRDTTDFPSFTAPLTRLLDWDQPV